MLALKRRLCAAGRLALAAALALICAAQSPPAATSAASTWYVTNSSDSASNGDAGARTGSLRFVLAHAAAGDTVDFSRLDTGADRIWAASPLQVPAGVTVGHRRSEDCGSVTTPLANIVATSWSVGPVLLLETGATLRNINIGSGDVSLRIAGDDVDVCAVGLGIEYDGDGVRIPNPPWHAALIVDGRSAAVHRSWINGAVSVTTNGSDSVLGDSLASSGEANRGFCGNLGGCAVTVLADATSAAQRVTLRDHFPRALHGMAATGVPGGDDDPTHANNWAQTPEIARAQTHDAFATVSISGWANPLSLVDIYVQDATSVTRRAPVHANAAGVFSFSGPLVGQPVSVFAASTLNDPAYPGRRGSSSQLSAPVNVQALPLTRFLFLPFVLR